MADCDGFSNEKSIYLMLEFENMNAHYKYYNDFRYLYNNNSFYIEKFLNDKMNTSGIYDTTFKSISKFEFNRKKFFGINYSKSYFKRMETTIDISKLYYGIKITYNENNRIYKFVSCENSNERGKVEISPMPVFNYNPFYSFCNIYSEGLNIEISQKDIDKESVISDLAYIFTKNINKINILKFTPCIDFKKKRSAFNLLEDFKIQCENNKNIGFIYRDNFLYLLEKTTLNDFSYKDIEKILQIKEL